MQTALEQAEMEAVSASAAESVGGDVRGSVASIVHSAQLDDVVFFETSSSGVAGDDGNDDDIDQQCRHHARGLFGAVEDCR